MAEILGGWLTWMFFAFGAAMVSLGVLMLWLLVLTLIHRAIALTFNLAAFWEVARELRRQGRSPWLDRAGRWNKG